MLGTHVCQDGLIAAVNEATSCCLCSLLLTSPGETPSEPHFPACTSTWINPREARWITKSSVRLSSSSPPEETETRAHSGCRVRTDGLRWVSLSVSLRGSMSDTRRRKTDRQLSWLKLDLDGTQLPLSSSGRAPKWRVGGWVGGLYVKLKEVGMDGKGTLKMFRKKRELIKTPSISKKSRAGSPGPQSSAPSVSSASLLVSDV